MDTLERSDAFPIGHNSNAAPLAEVLAEETAALKERAEALVESASRATVTDDDTAGKATLLIKMIKDHAKAIDEARVVRKAPFLEGGRTVDAHFGALAVPLVGADTKKLGGAAARVLALVDAHRRKKEEEAAAERRRLEEEARRLREEAAAAERRRVEQEEAARREREAAERRIREAEEAARRAGDQAAAEKAGRERAEAEAKRRREETEAAQRRLAGEIEQREREEAAARLQHRAETTTAAPIDTGYGVKASGRKVTKHHVVDAKAALKHAMKIDPVRFAATLDEVIKGQIKAKVTVFPGVEFYEETSTVIR